MKRSERMSRQLERQNNFPAVRLPVERYFNPELMREESAERQRVSHKLQLCPEEYLPIVEGAIDGALRIHEQEKAPVCV